MSNFNLHDLSPEDRERLAADVRAMSPEEREAFGFAAELERDTPPAEQPALPAPSDQPSVVSQPLAPGREGTTAPRIEVGGDGRPHPTAPPEPRRDVEPGETAPEFVGYQGQPTLVGGSAGDEVRELARALAELGYSSKVAEGLADPVLDDATFRAVLAFQRDHMDPEVVREELRNAAVRDGDVFVGAATWAAIARAGEGA